MFIFSFFQFLICVFVIENVKTDTRNVLRLLIKPPLLILFLRIFRGLRYSFPSVIKKYLDSHADEDTRYTHPL